MDLRLERAGPAVVFHVEKGCLVIEEDTAELHDLVRALTVFDPGCSVVLDLQKLYQLDCSGIGQLIEMRRQIGDVGGVFALVNVAAKHKRLLELLGLLRVLPVFASTQEAVTACWSVQARGGIVRDRQLEPSFLASRPVSGAGRPATLDL
jgi:stage II sporulation protein AA (anti-sigma F factor antagonist)